MRMDPAELIFFGEMSPEMFFEEAEKLGIPMEDLQDAETHDHVFHRCLINVRQKTAKAVAAELGISITDEQARSIARNSLTPAVMAEPAPLVPEERTIAEELYFHAVRAALARLGRPIKARQARAEAHRMVTAGERGLTTLDKISRASGCLAMVCVFAVGAPFAFLSVALLIM